MVTQRDTGSTDQGGGCHLCEQHLDDMVSILTPEGRSQLSMTSLSPFPIELRFRLGLALPKSTRTLM